MKCFEDAGTKNGKDLDTHCKNVDFDLLKKSMVHSYNYCDNVCDFDLQVQIAESKVCQYPECIAAIEKDIYTPCNRTDLGPCLKTCESLSVLVT